MVSRGGGVTTQALVGLSIAQDTSWYAIDASVSMHGWGGGGQEASPPRMVARQAPAGATGAGAPGIAADLPRPLASTQELKPQLESVWRSQGCACGRDTVQQRLRLLCVPHCCGLKVSAAPLTSTA